MSSSTSSGHTSRELRQSFLDFFAQHDHRVMRSAPLKPTDQTTLFTTAGMQQFVPWFRGLVPPGAPRVATCQKCFRADDVEEVGRTPWHLTFFEMLGNFSFGDYFKREAIEYAWEYVTEVLALPKERIWVTVHPEDDESPRIWREVIGVAPGRMAVDETNWWGPVGDSGPCGPDTELHVDTGEDRGCGRPDCNPTCDCRRFVEIWNLVFQVYNKTERGDLEPLPKPGIDTGLGFERVVAVLQGAPTIFETDLFAPIVSAVLTTARQVNRSIPEQLSDQQELAANIIAEHTRGLAFLLADGFTPSNEGAGYVLRRVLRRAYRSGRRLGLEQPFLHQLVPSVVETMGDVYPELPRSQPGITTWIQQEERQFEETLERAWGPLLDAIKLCKDAGWQLLRGLEAFRLYDTHGLPREIAAEVAAEHGLGFDEDGFNAAMEGQRQRARARAEQDFAFGGRSGYQSFVGKTRFLGYEELEATGVVIGIVKNGQPADTLQIGEEGEIFFDQTPFYAESGGQVGDRGALVGRACLRMPAAANLVADVLDTYFPVEGAHAHKVVVRQGELRVGQQVNVQVDSDRRQAIARAHTATHLLHHMLRQVLGEHAVQSGSLVDADRLRFDFAHFAALTDDERCRIEEGVLNLSLQDRELVCREMSLEEARAAGAIALFGEKYGEQVRVVEIGDFSKELCGGTHLPRASAIGGFAIVSEGSIGTGLRRIEAVTGNEFRALAARQRDLLDEAARALKCRPEDVAARLKSLQAELRQAERNTARLQHKSASALAGDLATQAVEVGGVEVVTARVEGLGSEALRALADQVRSKLGSGVVVLGCEKKGAVQFVSAVSQDLVAAGYHAGNLIREVAKLAGGGGGGRPDFAQAGGKNPERLDDALSKVPELVAAQSR